MQAAHCNLRLLPRAAALSGAIGLILTAPSLAATIPVTSCADDGSSGTLRHAVLIAASGDTVDLSALACSIITLTSGEIHVDVDPLTIQGPGAALLTIDGNNAGRVFYHSGTNALTLAGLTLAHGSVSAAPALGGCVFSKGSIYFDNAAVNACSASGAAQAAGGCILATSNTTLDHSNATACTVTGATQAVGGALYAGNNITLQNSTVTSSSATSATQNAEGGAVFAHNSASLSSSALIGNTATSMGAGTSAAGGGAAALQELYLSDSLLSGNVAQAPNGAAGGGGGANSGQLTSKYSTITGNQALGKGTGNAYYGKGGGLYGGSLSGALIRNSTIDHNRADIVGGLVLSGAGSATISQSTISSNTAKVASGGIDVLMNLTLSNSTIAFNSAGARGAAGLYAANGVAVDIESSIIADNSPSGPLGGADLAGPGTITGSHDLIKISSVPVPAGTLSADPMLGPLACNGGPTRTHALQPESTAIDAGANPSSFTDDQRGPGFARDVGIAPDIGAVEYDPDRILADGFDC